MRRRDFLSSAAAAAALLPTAALAKPSRPPLTLRLTRPHPTHAMPLGLLIYPRWPRRNHQARARPRLPHLLPLSGQVHRQLHARPRHAVQSLLAKYNSPHHRRSGRPAAAGVGLHAGPLHHRPRPARHPRRPHRRPAPGIRFRQTARHHQVQTHCGFIPEDPADPLYKETVDAIRTSPSIAAQTVSTSSWRPARKPPPPCRAPSAT